MRKNSIFIKGISVVLTVCLLWGNVVFGGEIPFSRNEATLAPEYMFSNMSDANAVEMAVRIALSRDPSLIMSDRPHELFLDIADRRVYMHFDERNGEDDSLYGKCLVSDREYSVTVTGEGEGLDLRVEPAGRKGVKGPGVWDKLLVLITSALVVMSCSKDADKSQAPQTAGDAGVAVHGSDTDNDVGHILFGLGYSGEYHDKIRTKIDELSDELGAEDLAAVIRDADRQTALKELYGYMRRLREKVESEKGDDRILLLLSRGILGEDMVVDVETEKQTEQARSFLEACTQYAQLSYILFRSMGAEVKVGVSYPHAFNAGHAFAVVTLKDGTEVIFDPSAYAILDLDRSGSYRRSGNTYILKDELREDTAKLLGIRMKMGSVVDAPPERTSSMISAVTWKNLIYYHIFFDGTGGSDVIRVNLMNLFSREKAEDAEKYYTALKEVLPETRSPITDMAEINYASMLLSSGSYEEALKRAEDLLASNPENVVLMTLYAKVLNLMGRSEESLEYFRKVNKIAPLYPENLFFFGKALAERGDMRSAADILDLYFSCGEGSEKEFLWFFDKLYKKGMADRGIYLADFLLKEGIIRDRDNEDLVRAMAAELCVKEGAYGKALGYLEGCGEAFRREWGYLNVRIEALYGSGEKEVAFDEARGAVRREPENIEPLILLGQLYKREGETARAVVVFEKVLSLEGHGEDKTAIYGIADAYLRRGLLVLARDWAEKLKEIAPGDFQPYYLLGRIEEKEGDHQAALSAYERCMRMTSPKGEIYLRVALVHIELNDLEKAENYCRLALSLAREHKTVLLELGRIKGMQGDHAEALRIFKDLLRRYPEDTRVLKLCAYANRASGNIDKAIEQYTALCEKYPRNPEGWLLLGDLHYDEGEKDKSIECFVRAVAADTRVFKVLPDDIKKPVREAYLRLREEERSPGRGNGGYVIPDMLAVMSLSGISILAVTQAISSEISILYPAVILAFFVPAAVTIWYAARRSERITYSGEKHTVPVNRSGNGISGYESPLSSLWEGVVTEEEPVLSFEGTGSFDKEKSDPVPEHLLVDLLASLSFGRKLVLAFDKGLARYQDERTMTILDVLKKLKRKPEYSRLLDRIVILRGGPAEINAEAGRIREDPDAEIIVLARKGVEKDLTSVVPGKKVMAVFVDEDDFPVDAHYPLLEILTLVVAQKAGRVLGDKGAYTSLSLPGGEISLTALNIEKLEVDGQKIIFKLLPEAERFELRTLLKNNGLIKRVLLAA